MHSRAIALKQSNSLSLNNKELDCAPILGLSTSEKMKLVNVQQTNFVNAIHIKNYDTVFSNGLG